jgi:hypothetical protein
MKGHDQSAPTCSDAELHPDLWLAGKTNADVGSAIHDSPASSPPRLFGNESLDECFHRSGLQHRKVNALTNFCVRWRGRSVRVNL